MRENSNQSAASSSKGLKSRVLPEMDLSTQETVEGWLFVLPKLAIILGVLFVPLLFAFYISLTSSNLLNLPGNFVGLDNYIWLLNYEVFWTSLKNISLIGLVMIPANLLLALVSSLLLMERVRGQSLYRLAFLVPVAGPAIIWAIVWKFLLFPGDAGLVNHILMKLGIINEGIAWLTNTQLALPSVIFTLLWGFGVSMLVYMAALSGLPESLLETAELDGANRWQKLRYIIWPLLRPTTYFLIIIQVINVLRRSFGVVFVMTEGGPIDATMVPSYLAYTLAFVNNNFGRSAALSMIMFVLTIGLTLLLRKPLQNQTEY